MENCITVAETACFLLQCLEIISFQFWEYAKKTRLHAAIWERMFFYEAFHI